MAGRIRWEEIYDLGVTALVEARAEWDGRGDFEAFAIQRVRWAMQDSLRKRRRDPVTLALSAAELAARQHDRSAASVARLGDEAQPLAELSIQEVVDDAALNYSLDLGSLEEAEEDVERLHVRRAVKALTPPQDEVMERYVYKGETFAEVAEAMGLSTTAVFKIHAQAVRNLKAMLTAAPPKPTAPTPKPSKK